MAWPKIANLKTATALVDLALPHPSKVRINPPSNTNVRANVILTSYLKSEGTINESIDCELTGNKETTNTWRILSHVA